MGRTVPESPGPNQLPLGGGQGQRLTAHGLFRKWSGFWKITQRERQRTITRKSGEGSRLASGASPSPASHHDATEDTENGENAYGLSGKYELNTTQSMLSPGATLREERVAPCCSLTRPGDGRRCPDPALLSAARSRGLRRLRPKPFAPTRVPGAEEGHAAGGWDRGWDRRRDQPPPAPAGEKTGPGRPRPPRGGESVRGAFWALNRRPGAGPRGGSCSLGNGA